jgi:hypothetical protein
MGLAAVVVITIAWPRPSPQVPTNTIADRAGRIWPGMSDRDVEAILGVPPGNYSARHVLHRSGVGYAPWERPGRVDLWRWDDDFVAVSYDADGTVKQLHYECDSDPRKNFSHLRGSAPATD